MRFWQAVAAGRVVALESSSPILESPRATEHDFHYIHVIATMQIDRRLRVRAGVQVDLWEMHPECKWHAIDWCARERCFDAFPLLVVRHRGSPIFEILRIDRRSGNVY